MGRDLNGGKGLYTDDVKSVFDRGSIIETAVVIVAPSRPDLARNLVPLMRSNKQTSTDFCLTQFRIHGPL